MSNRRENVPFDPYYFEKQFSRGATPSIEETFRHIYHTNHWNSVGTVSGNGSTKEQIHQIWRELPSLLKTLQIDVFLDLPCGDFGWMQSIHLPVSTYIGADIVPELIAWNQKHHEKPYRRFIALDLTQDSLPLADLLFCRDCFVHLSCIDIQRSLTNIKQSGITYLLTTTFPECRENEDITTGDWRLLNLEKPPFNFPPPLQLINEGCSEEDGLYRDKSLGLWSVPDLPNSLKH